MCHFRVLKSRPNISMKERWKSTRTIKSWKTILQSFCGLCSHEKFPGRKAFLLQQTLYTMEPWVKRDPVLVEDATLTNTEHCHNIRLQSFQLRKSFPIVLKMRDLTLKAQSSIPVFANSISSWRHSVPVRYPSEFFTISTFQTFFNFSIGYHYGEPQG